MQHGPASCIANCYNYFVLYIQKLSISSSSLLNDTSFSGLSGLNASGSSQQMASITRKLEEKYVRSTAIITRALIPQ